MNNFPVPPSDRQFSTFRNETPSHLNPFPIPKPSLPPKPPSPPRKSIYQKAWAWWSSLTGPNKNLFRPDLFAQEQLRRARLTSALLLIIVLVILMMVPSIYPSSPSLLIPISILTIGGIVIAFFNRLGYTRLSTISYVLLADIALTCFFIFKPNPALNSSNMTAFDLFILVVLIGGVILPKVLIPFNGMLQILLIFTIFFLRPHDASMNELVAISGNEYVALTATLVLHVVGTVLGWLNAWSVERALIRASQAEELAETRAELSRQALVTAKLNQHLEEGINTILETHRQVAAGNLAARAPVQEDHELWQIGHSLNLLLMRVQQQSQSYQALQLTQKEIEMIIHVLYTSRSGARQSLPPCRTPLAQRLLMALRG